MGPVHSEIIIIMKAFIFASFLAVAAAIPLEDTAEVLAAKAVFNAAFAAATAGDHAALAPVQGAATYMAVLPEVAEATAAHAAVFNAYTAGTVALPVAPVFTGVQPAHVVAPVVATPMPTIMVPTVPTLPTPMLPMLVPMLVTPMLVPTVPMVDMVDTDMVDTPMPSPWQLPKPNKSEKIRKK